MNTEQYIEKREQHLKYIMNNYNNTSNVKDFSNVK